MSESLAASVRDFDDPKLEALVETMFLAAYADEELGDEERAHFAESIQSLSERRFEGGRLDALITRMKADLDKEGREARLASVKGRLADAASRKVALSLAIRVTAADGIIRTSERELIMEVAEALEIDRDEAANLVKELASG